MKKHIFTILFALGALLVSAQTLDVTEFSQNIARMDTATIPLSAEVQHVASYPEITEVYQIPSYDLYDQYWDVQNLRSRKLEIPFSDNRLMLILVQAANNPFEVPCSFDVISQKFGVTRKGDFHPGVDLTVEPQTLVKSCFDGVVRMVRFYGQYGLTVVVRHYNGLETVYAHLDKVCVKPGQIVNAGNVIGQTGNTGNVKDYTLHFETRFMNEFFDPELIIDFDNETLIKNSLVLTPDDFKIIEIDEVAKGVVMGVSSTQSKPNSAPKVTQPSQSPAQPQAQPAQSQQTATDAEVQYHVVKKGESLYRIAVTYGTTTEKIRQLNNIQNADMIQEGQRLRVK